MCHAFISVVPRHYACVIMFFYVFQNLSCDIIMHSCASIMMAQPHVGVSWKVT